MIDKTQQYLWLAKITSLRSTCPRRQTGCIITDKQGHILSTGYNGVAPGFPHCTEHACPGAEYSSGEGLDECLALHAEWNAILQCKDLDRAHTMYTVAGICRTCIKILAGTPIQFIYYVETYAGEREVHDYWHNGLQRNIFKTRLEELPL